MEELQVKKTFTEGIAIAKAFVLKEKKFSIEKKNIDSSMAVAEVEKLKVAIEAVKKDLEELSKENEIFMAHLELANDDSLVDTASSKIQDENKNASWAIDETIEEIATIFDEMDDEYMRERGADIRDIGHRILSHLSGDTSNPFAGINENVIVVAKDLAPSDTALMDFNFIKGFITEEGGVTSHVAIIAKNKNIPALVGVSGIRAQAKDDVIIAMNAGTGEIVIDPDLDTQQAFLEKKIKFEEHNKQLQAVIGVKTQTKSGREVSVCVNVGNLEDIKDALDVEPDGIGLFRTEFLFMSNTHFPTEEEQFVVYKHAAELMGGKEVIIRTLDIGGDKGLPYFEFPKEDNPFLGYRAIRICLDKKDVFKTQLRALLRASAYGNIKIMFPMIIALEEFDESKKLVKECMDELEAEGQSFNKDIKVGMMIETPASVVMADEFAKRADFFSIGTNDLTQYTLAVDRGNKKIDYLYNSFNPAVLKSIKRTIDCAHKEGIRCGMCGEFASNKEAFEILNGYGLDEFSMSKGSVLEIKSRILQSP